MQKLRHASDISVYEKRIALGKGLNTTAKLTEAQVRTARIRYAEGDKTVTGASLAREYGVRPRTMQDILRRKTWTHI